VRKTRTARNAAAHGRFASNEPIRGQDSIQRFDRGEAERDLAVDDLVDEDRTGLERSAQLLARPRGPPRVVGQQIE